MIWQMRIYEVAMVCDSNAMLWEFNVCCEKYAWTDCNNAVWFANLSALCVFPPDAFEPWDISPSIM